LDEVTEGSLLPSDPLEKAQHRAMIELGSAILADGWLLAVATEEEDARRHARALHDKLRRFEDAMVGPLYTGESLSLVDAAMLPALLRLEWVDQMAPSLELLAGLPKVRRWLEVGGARPSVQRSSVADLRERYQQIFIKRGSWVGRQIA
ncbi:MAG: glutathione S-transferase C-terminal domain-containing protein, partial [Myxococcales bacterium]|nr:glutathione S-transferase C-terminal domain-containing protein [Myxococcales bacterium]